MRHWWWRPARSKEKVDLIVKPYRQNKIEESAEARYSTMYGPLCTKEDGRKRELGIIIMEKLYGSFRGYVVGNNNCIFI